MKLHYLLAVGLGGALGSGFRYMIARLLADTPSIATFSVNILGSFPIRSNRSLLHHTSRKVHLPIIIRDWVLWWIYNNVYSSLRFFHVH